MSRRSRSTSIIGAGLVALALVAGCGTGTGVPPSGPTVRPVGQGLAHAAPAELLAGAAAATAAAGSAGLEIRSEASQAGQVVMTSHASGAYDFDRRLGRLSMERRSAGPSGTVDVVVDGDAVYWTPPGGQGLQRTEPEMVPAGQHDPIGHLRALHACAYDLRLVGAEELHGEPVRHIAFTVDAERLRAAQGLPEPTEPGAVSGPIPVDVWVDGQGRVRRLGMVLSLMPGGVPARTDVQVEYLEFGVAVDVPGR